MKALQILDVAQVVAITLPTLCEFVWVLDRTYKRSKSELIAAIRSLLDIGSVRVDGPAVEAGLAFLEAGGDFADGVIAFEGQRLGGEVFATFDRRAANLVSRTGMRVKLLTS